MYVRRDPYLADVYRDPRFRDFLREIGLPESPAGP